MYSLIFKSRNKKAKEITDWVTQEIMPSIRKYGEYKLTHPLKEQIDTLNIRIHDLNKTINEQDDEIDILEHNLKKPKYKKGGMVYILRTITNKINYNLDEKLYIKFGKTKKDMNKRKPPYDTACKNRVQILKTIYVDDPDTIEKCVIKKMDEYRIQDRKEYFKCSYNEIVNEIASCVKFYENKDIDKKPDKENEINRIVNELDINKKMEAEIIDEEDFDELCGYESDDELENESDSESDDESENKINEIIQKGGYRDMLPGYLIYKKKYLELKFDLL